MLCGSGEDSIRPEKHRVSEADVEKASNPASLSTSERYSHFSRLMKEWGFTSTQLLLVSDAIRESGLEIRTKEF